MFSNTNFSIPESYYNSKNKIYTESHVLYKNSITVESFDADRFARWLQAAYEESTYKSQARLAVAVGSNQASVSRWMNAANQSTTNKPTQPPSDIVIKLAKELKKDINEALIAAGHAPLEGQILPPPLVLADFDGLDEDDLLDVKEYAELLRIRKEKRASNEERVSLRSQHSNPAGFKVTTDEALLDSIPFEDDNGDKKNKTG